MTTTLGQVVLITGLSLSFAFVGALVFGFIA